MAQCGGYCCVCVCVCVWAVQFISVLIPYKTDCKHCFVLLSYLNMMLHIGGRLLQCPSLCVSHTDGNECKWTERNDVNP